MKRIYKIVIGITLFFGLGIGFMVYTLNSNMKEIRAIEITDFDVTTYQDDVYIGEYYYENQIGATVEVHIENGLIIDIVFVEHICGKGDIAEVIVEDIIREQSLFVDNIAGATTSSHVIKLAVQDALEEIE